MYMYIIYIYIYTVVLPVSVKQTLCQFPRDMPLGIMLIPLGIMSIPIIYNVIYNIPVVKHSAIPRFCRAGLESSYNYTY